MAIHLDSQQSFKKVGIQTKIIKVLGKNADHWFEVFIFEKRAMWYVVNEDGNPGFEPLKKQKVLSRIKHDKTLLLNIYIVKYRMWMLPTPEIYSSNPFILNGIMKYLKDEKRSGITHCMKDKAKQCLQLPLLSGSVCAYHPVAQVWIPSTTSMLWFSNWNVKRRKMNKKRQGFAHKNVYLERCLLSRLIISNLLSVSGTSSRLQKQMTIMNKNLSSKLEELHGFQAIDTNVALTEIRSQLHELTKSVESCQVWFTCLTLLTHLNFKIRQHVLYYALNKLKELFTESAKVNLAS